MRQSDPVIIVEEFRAEDLRRILRIEQEAFGSRAWNAAMFRQYAVENPHLFLVAKVGGMIAAYSVSRIVGRRAELDSIAVARRYQHRGIGGTFLGLLIGKLRRTGCETLSLMVRRDNHSAIRLYRTLGFRRIRTVPFYYEDNETAWRMQLAFS